MSAEIVRREPRGPVHRVSAAQQRAERIRTRLADAAGEYATAVLEGDWDALGYGDVSQWAADQFGQHKFTPDARRQVAELLSARGKTVRQIAAATGVSKSTAAGDVAGVRKPDTSSPRQQAAARREERKRQEENERQAARVREQAGYLSMGADDVPPEQVMAVAVGDVAKQEAAAGPDPGPQPCPRCAPQIAELAAQVKKLRTAHPDAVLTQERDWLAARVAGLEAELRSRPSQPRSAPEPVTPAGEPQVAPEAADPALSEPDGQPEPSARVPCGGTEADRVVITVAGERKHVNLLDGGELEWLCREHRAAMAAELGRAGARVDPEPADPLSFDFGTCQFPVPAGVTA